MYDNGQQDEGRAYVYHGSASGLRATDVWTAESNQAGAWFGNATAAAGDVNRDGYADVIVGAYLYDSAYPAGGRAYVYYGSSAGLVGSPWVVSGQGQAAYLGHSVGTAGDVNGDGFADIVIGSDRYDGDQQEEGRVYVYHGSSTGLATGPADWMADGNQAGIRFGLAVGTAGDVNGDGYADLLVSAPYYDGGRTDQGRVYVYHGSGSTAPPPRSGFAASPRSGSAPLTVQFTDQSTGQISAWSWSFGDGGTSSAQSPRHTYADPGRYAVSLTVSGPGGSDTETKTNYIAVQEAIPVSGFSGTPRSGSAPLTVQFTDQSTGQISAWSWNFGDGSTSTAQDPSHTYADPGTYTVRLTVTGPGGSDTEAKTGYIQVSPPGGAFHYAYLPKVSQGYALPLENGDFAQGMEGWAHQQGPFAGHGRGLDASIVLCPEPEGGMLRNCARLGTPEATDGSIPVGYGYIAKTFDLQAPRLHITFRISSYDTAWGTTGQAYFDTFEVSINRHPTDIETQERHDRGCQASPGLPPAEPIPVTTDGLVFCGGGVGSRDTLWDSGWVTLKLDMSEEYQRHRPVTLYLAVWSREYKSPERNDQAYYNTWVHIDQIAERP
jgi:PKD repeat protein